MFVAFLLESRFPKREILKLYLDRAYMGGGAFGVEAASQFYFGKSVRNINLSEAALLAGLYKAPTKYAPHVNLPAARARTNEVLSNLVESGFYTSGQVHAARLSPAQLVENRPTNSPDVVSRLGLRGSAAHCRRQEPICAYRQDHHRPDHVVGC